MCIFFRSQYSLCRHLQVLVRKGKQNKKSLPQPAKKSPFMHHHNHHRLAELLLSSFSCSLISISASLMHTSAISLPTLQVRSVTPLRSMTALDLAQRCCHKYSFLPMPSPGLAGMPSSLQAPLSRFLRVEVVKERVLPTRRGGGGSGGAKGRVLEDEGSKAGSKLERWCCLLGGLPYARSDCQEPGIGDGSGLGLVSVRLPAPRRVGSGGGCLGLETERWT